LASALTSAQLSDSPRATYPASYALRLSRSSHTLSRRGRNGVPGETEATPGVQGRPRRVRLELTGGHGPAKPTCDLGVDEMWCVQLILGQRVAGGSVVEKR